MIYNKSCICVISYPLISPSYPFLQVSVHTAGIYSHTELSLPTSICTDGRNIQPHRVIPSYKYLYRRQEYTATPSYPFLQVSVQTAGIYSHTELSLPTSICTHGRNIQPHRVIPSYKYLYRRQDYTATPSYPFLQVSVHIAGLYSHTELSLPTSICTHGRNIQPPYICTDGRNIQPHRVIPSYKYLYRRQEYTATVYLYRRQDYTATPSYPFLQVSVHMAGLYSHTELSLPTSICHFMSRHIVYM